MEVPGHSHAFLSPLFPRSLRKYCTAWMPPMIDFARGLACWIWLKLKPPACTHAGLMSTPMQHILSVLCSALFTCGCPLTFLQEPIVVQHCDCVGH